MVSISRELVMRYGKALLTLEEAGEVVGKTKKTLQNQICEERCEIPVTTFANQYVVPADRLAEYLDQKSQEAEAGCLIHAR